MNNNFYMDDPIIPDHLLKSFKVNPAAPAQRNIQSSMLLKSMSDANQELIDEVICSKRSRKADNDRKKLSMPNARIRYHQSMKSDHIARAQKAHKRGDVSKYRKHLLAAVSHQKELEKLGTPANDIDEAQGMPGFRQSQGRRQMGAGLQGQWKVRGSSHAARFKPTQPQPKRGQSFFKRRAAAATAGKVFKGMLPKVNQRQSMIPKSADINWYDQPPVWPDMDMCQIHDTGLDNFIVKQATGGNIWEGPIPEKQIVQKSQSRQVRRQAPMKKSVTSTDDFISQNFDKLASGIKGINHQMGEDDMIAGDKDGGVEW